MDETERLREAARGGDAEAAFQLGRGYAARSEFSRARRYLRDAAERGHGGALTELAVFLLWGIGIDEDKPEALRLLLAAEQAGSAEAMYTLGWLGFSAVLVPLDRIQMGERLRRAALGDCAPALRSAALIYRHMSANESSLSALSERCMERSAALGDLAALQLLGIERARSSDPESRASGIASLVAAAARGSYRAGELLGAEVAAADAAAPDRNACAQLTDLPPIDLTAELPTARKGWSEQPFIETVDGVMARFECEYIIALGGARVKSSLVIGEQARVTRNRHRTSSDMAFDSFQEDFGLRWLQTRMTDLVGVPLDLAEPLVLLRYLPGEEYRPHRDYLPPMAGGGAQPFGPAGQRVHTVFTYLNDVEAGGETAFPLQDIRIQPQTGRVVHFLNLKPNGQIDDGTLHAGSPVERGSKWLATLWTRQRRFREY